MSYTSLEELRSDRRDYVESARRNKFEDGLRTLLADLYPDNAHFIYELLQNAEDAQATAVEFALERDGLIVSHNGTRLFTLRDIEAITGIGQSPKKDDETQIGKFGVGFKAVLAYTSRPEVYSGEYAFAIDDLFVPEPVQHDAVAKTTFVFPFDRPEKPPAVAYEEIARGLRELGSSTVLFLSHITTIEYTLADGSGGRVSRADLDYPRITITQSADGQREETHWIRVVGSPEGLGGHHSVAAAFKLSEPSAKGDKSKPSDRLRVQPLDHGETCIYFPAAKETSGLRFHIHAPFASTVTRDSVRDTEDNAGLVEAIGRLIADVLPKLRDDGFLDDGLLAALPNADDPLDAPFGLIRDRIHEAFWEHPLTPTFGGGGSYAPAKYLFSSPSEFRRGLDQADLAVLMSLATITFEEDPRWIAPREGKAGQFLRGLKVAEFGWTQLEEALGKVAESASYETWLTDDDEDEVDDEQVEADRALAAWHGWIEPKADVAVRRFYELLGHGILDQEFSSWFSWSELPVVRVRDGTTTSLVTGSGIYLPADRDDLGPDRVPTSLAFFDDEEPSKANSALEAFYKRAGITRFDDRAVVKQRLAAYLPGLDEYPDRPQHLRDVRLFIKHVKEHPSDLVQMRSRRLLWGDDSEGKTWWASASEIVIDEPFQATGLSVVYPGKKRLSERYYRQVAGIVEFAMALGTPGGLTLQRVSPRGNRHVQNQWLWDRETDRGSRWDWDLPMFDEILASENPVLLRSLWELACSEVSEKAFGRYQANARTQSHRFPSRIAQRLSSGEWILDRFGDLRSPQSMTPGDLPDDWEVPGANSLAVAVGFGEDARSRESEQQARREWAESLGIPLEIADELAALDEASQREALDFMRELRDRPSFPSSASLDPERRAAIVGGDARDAPEHQTEVRERSVATGESNETRQLADRYLRELYTNDDGVLFCQGCHQPAEFKIDGEWYFEKVQFLLRRKYLHFQNYLALCPLCAAKYKYVRRPDDDGLLATVRDIPMSESAGTVVVPISLNGRRVELKFTGKHMVDLKAVLTAKGEVR